MIRKTTRTVEVEARTVAFEHGVSDAIEVLAGYFGFDLTRCPRTVGGDVFRKRYGANTSSESAAVAYAAACEALTYMSENVRQDVLTELGIKTCPDGPAEPTWTSSDGTSTRVRDLPTPYLRNIERKAQRMAGTLSDEPHGAGSGLVCAIREELRKRDERKTA